MSRAFRGAQSLFEFSVHELILWQSGTRLLPLVNTNELSYGTWQEHTHTQYGARWQGVREL